MRRLKICLIELEILIVAKVDLTLIGGRLNWEIAGLYKYRLCRGCL